MMQPEDDKTRTYLQLAKDTIVGHYRIIEKIGAGGMGVVYLAEDSELNRKVALKFLPPDLCQDADCRARFKREAQAAAKLNHPNIVTIYEVSEFNGWPFFAMEHVEGLRLDEHLKQKSLSLDKILDLAVQVCEGLREAHNNGIVHRDIKPGNILVDKNGRTKILDFGLATIKGTDKLTKTGSTLGTLSYMSPEQTRGEEVDHRSDIFSFGSVLYEMITGQLPFKGDHEPAIIYSIGYEEPEPLVRYKTGVPDELQRIVSKALAKEKTLRYQHADDLLTDLKRISTPAAARPRQHLSSRSLQAIASLVILILIPLGYWGVSIFVSEENRKPESELKMLAVLPLESIGPAEQDYFADGLTDEITTKLSGVSELRVIARSSAAQYKRTTKTVAQIGKELGAGYLLQGTIRWQQMPDGSQRLRVNPQLVQVSDGAQIWSQSYESALASVFEVQSDIATQVAGALDVALQRAEQRAIEEKPTNNIEAYEYYLRGLQLWGRTGREAPEKSIALLRQAVALDPSFASAYAYIARTYAWLYFQDFGKDAAQLEEARKALDKALALQPASVDVDLAQGDYYYYGFRDYHRALQHYNDALSKSPNNGDVLAPIAYVKRRLGKYAEAADLLLRSLLLDPRSPWLPFEIGVTYWCMRDYAKAEEYLRRSSILCPEDLANWNMLSNLYVAWRGDTAAARGVLREARAHVDSSNLALSEWLLDVVGHDYSAAERRLNGLLSTKEVDTSGYYFARAWTAQALGQADLARACYDSLRKHGEQGIKTNPTVYAAYEEAGLGYAGLGRKDSAIALGKKAVELMPLEKDASEGVLPLYSLARIYAMLGDEDAAIDQLERVLSNPGLISWRSLKLEPYWESIRNNPRFQKLLEKYGT